MKDLVFVARIESTFGVSGECRFRSFSGEFEHILKLKSVTLVRKDRQFALEVETVTVRSGQGYIKFLGIDSPEAAKKFIDFKILVGRELASPLSHGEVYVDDLIGCAVFDGIQTLGIVESFFDTGNELLLEVRSNSGRLVVLPYNSHFIGNVDISGKAIEVIVEGLIS